MRLRRGLKARWPVSEASGAFVRLSLRFPGASCRFFGSIETCGMRLADILGAASKHVGRVLRRREIVFPKLGGDITVIGHF